MSSAISGNNRALSFAIVNPAVQNNRSTGAEVAGIQRIRLASVANVGNLNS